MPYSSRDDVTIDIPPDFLVQALDDDGDRVEDEGLFQKIQARADRKVDALLSSRYTTPFVGVIPPLVAEAATVFCGEMIYGRRGRTGEENPFGAAADDYRERLLKIADGEAELALSNRPARPPVSLITERSRVHSRRNNI